VIPGGAPTKKVEGGYGLTEMCSFATGRPNIEAPEDPTDQGIPLPGVTLRIVRTDGTTAARNEQGEIAVGGPALFSRYQKQSAVDLRDPGGLFMTGDLGHVDVAGHLHWEGRSDSMIRSRGVLISPIEIEEILMASGFVKIAKVVAISDSTGETVPALFAVLHASVPVTKAEIVTLLKSRLPDYKVPKSVTFVPEEDLVFTDTNKVQLEAFDALVKRLVDEHHLDHVE
jgi:acyl-CoA synthetase (AMP-forming)/AMP-acid ligase II